MFHVHRAHNLLESITARTKRDHWVPGLDGKPEPDEVAQRQRIVRIMQFCLVTKLDG